MQILRWVFLPFLLSAGNYAEYGAGIDAGAYFPKKLNEIDSPKDKIGSDQAKMIREISERPSEKRRKNFENAKKKSEICQNKFKFQEIFGQNGNRHNLRKLVIP